MKGTSMSDVETVKTSLRNVALGAAANGDDAVAALFEAHIVAIERLEAVVDAARAFMTADVVNTLLTHPMDWADDDGDLERLARLRDALATLGGE